MSETMLRPAKKDLGQETEDRMLKDIILAMIPVAQSFLKYKPAHKVRLTEKRFFEIFSAYPHGWSGFQSRQIYDSKLSGLICLDVFRMVLKKVNQEQFENKFKVSRFPEKEETFLEGLFFGRLERGLMQSEGFSEEIRNFWMHVPAEHLEIE